MPGPITSLNSGMSAMLTVRRSSCGRATTGSGTPLPVRIIPGETVAVMIRTFSYVFTDFDLYIRITLTTVL